MQVNIGTQLNNSRKKRIRAYVRALEKADTPSDPVEQTTRIAAPAPPSHWPLQRARGRASGTPARRRGREREGGLQSADARVSDRWLLSRPWASHFLLCVIVTPVILNWNDLQRFHLRSIIQVGVWVAWSNAIHDWVFHRHSAFKAQ